MSSWSLRKQSSATSLQRHPSAPVYPRAHPAALSSREHLRTKSNAFGSSSSSIDQHSARQSPVLNNVSEFGNQSPANIAPSQEGTYNNTSRLSFERRNSDELIGAPFDARGMLNALESTRSDQPPLAQRPPLLQSYKTSPDPATSNRRQSGSFATNNTRMGRAPPTTGGEMVSVSTSKRYSDDGTGSRFGFRRKTGLSSLMNSMLGSPRSIKISAPENPVHVTHVGYDNDTGQFTVS